MEIKQNLLTLPPSVVQNNRIADSVQGKKHLKHSKTNLSFQNNLADPHTGEIDGIVDPALITVCR